LNNKTLANFHLNDRLNKWFNLSHEWFILAQFHKESDLRIDPQFEWLYLTQLFF
jgi:hypothetical protein